jgi:hypothetical protein
MADLADDLGASPQSEPSWQQQLIDHMRKLAQTVGNRYPWDPTVQQDEVSQDQATSDRLSSPNHRLPVKTTAPSK